MRIIRKITFTLRVVSIGSGPVSKATLLLQALYTQVNLYLKFSPIPFSCRIQVSGRSAMMRFQGTLDEMHALTEIFKDKVYDPHSELRLSNAIDLGANIGTASIWFILNYPEIHIDAYEPNPLVFALLEQNLAPFSHARAFQCAVSEKDGEISFYQSNRSFASSIFDQKDTRRIVVRSVTLDEAVERIAPVDLLKIDIEGAETGVLSSSKSLASIPIIVGETHGYLADIVRKTHDFYGTDGTRNPFYAHSLTSFIPEPPSII